VVLAQPTTPAAGRLIEKLSRTENSQTIDDAIDCLEELVYSDAIPGMCACMNICIHTNVCMYVCMHACMHVFAMDEWIDDATVSVEQLVYYDAIPGMCVCMYIYTYKHRCMYVCVHVCMFECMYARVCDKLMDRRCQ